MAIDDSILRHYEVIDERGRLSGRASGELEYARTRAIMSRFLPPVPARILDVGGAAGRYASPLAAEGYEVTLIDPVPHHVAQATATSQVESASFEALEGDARALPRPDGSVDAVLLLGPLYHLDREGRAQALAEAHRVLRPGGVLVAAAITRFASLRAPPGSERAV
jgi:SAM-dependent methyltransferase